MEAKWRQVVILPLLSIICVLHFCLGGCPVAQRLGNTLHSTVVNAEETQIVLQESGANSEVNNEFIEYYEIALKSLIPKTKIIATSLSVTLIKSNGTRYTAPVRPDIYTNLKIISHVPLGAWTILIANTSESIFLDPVTISNLTTYLQSLNTIQITPTLFPGGASQIQTQEKILAETVNFVENVISTGRCSRIQLSDFAWSMNSYIDENLNTAASSQINMTHDIVMNWKNNLLTLEEWEELYVATPTSHMVAQDQLMYQYFGRLFNVIPNSGSGEHQNWEYYDTKVYNMGGYATEPAIINVVGKHFIDGEIGTDFFHNSDRMHHDALMVGAKLACDAIFGPNEVSNPNAPPSDTETDKEKETPWETIAIIFIALFVLSFTSLLALLTRQYSQSSFTRKEDSKAPQDKVRMTVQMSPISI